MCFRKMLLFNNKSSNLSLQHFIGTGGTVVEHWTAKGKVEGSNPGRGKKFFSTDRWNIFLLKLTAQLRRKCDVAFHINTP